MSRCKTVVTLNNNTQTIPNSMHYSIIGILSQVSSPASSKGLEIRKCELRVRLFNSSVTKKSTTTPSCSCRDSTRETERTSTILRQRLANSNRGSIRLWSRRMMNMIDFSKYKFQEYRSSNFCLCSFQYLM
jgi:hypothetical protein